MLKKTKKLIAALEVLNAPYSERQPNVVIYGKMAEQGYEWNGENWTRNGAPIELSYPVLIRVMGPHRLEVLSVGDKIAQCLHDAGLSVQAKSPVENRDGAGYRQYITIE